MEAVRATLASAAGLILGLLAPHAAAAAQPPTYDLVLKGGHVLDPANHVNAPRDVAITGHTIQAVAPDIPAQAARHVVDVTGLYVVPGLIDMHNHVTIGLWLNRPGYPADLNLASGVTTVVDAGTCGAHDFDLFRKTVIDRSQVRVLAFLNIIAGGMDAVREQDAHELDPHLCAVTIRANRDVLVGVKTAHFAARGPVDAHHPAWAAIDAALEAGRLAGVPIMVDTHPRPERPYEELILHKLRPGDIHTHVFGDCFHQVDEHGRVIPALFQAHQRGVRFDLGHGGASFVFRNAVPAIHQGFWPDTLSTDLHQGSANGPAFNMMSVMSKIASIGMPLEEVVRRVTANPAQVINRPDLGTLTPGHEADVAVFAVRQGSFRYVDSAHTRMTGNVKLENRLTLRAGQVAYDPTGLTMPDWDKVH